MEIQEAMDKLVAELQPSFPSLITVGPNSNFTAIHLYFKSGPINSIPNLYCGFNVLPVQVGASRR